MKENKFYITTPIYYVNDKPHIGHAYTTVAADVLARYHRLRGDDVHFLTGNDEHGDKVARSAEEAGQEPQAFCDEMSAKYQLTWDRLNIGYDDYIRTTEPRHKEAVQDFLTVLRDKGAIYEGTYEGLYCTGCEKFLTDKELVDGECPDHKKAPEKLSEKNYFFKLGDYLNEVKRQIEKDEIKVGPENIKREVLGLFKQDLQDFSVSRESVKWGIELPFDKSQKTYVWVEALQNYITAIGYKDDQKKFKRYWPADVHLMAKDIIKFHAIFWPAMLLAADLPVPKQIFAHGFFTIDGQKMSKTIGNVIDPNDLVDEYGADATRYLILSQFPFGQDGDIKAEKFAEQYNDQLANNLGNMFSRVMKLGQDVGDGKGESDGRIEKKVNEIWPSFEKAMKDLQIDQGLEAVRTLTDFGNKYIDTNKPWKLKKTDPGKFNVIMLELLEMLRHIAWLVQPFLPETSDKMLEQLGATSDKDLDHDGRKKWREFDAAKMGEGVILFPRI
ncbi:methionine--tRNA ligase [Patescibacteria group bacterium]|nr:methionine--tRNA ligase [Patescibacteria group bacterium]